MYHFWGCKYAEGKHQLVLHVNILAVEEKYNWFGCKTWTEIVCFKCLSGDFSSLYTICRYWLLWKVYLCCIFLYFFCQELVNKLLNLIFLTSPCLDVWYAVDCWYFRGKWLATSYYRGKSFVTSYYKGEIVCYKQGLLYLPTMCVHHHWLCLFITKYLLYLL